MVMAWTAVAAPTDDDGAADADGSESTGLEARVLLLLLQLIHSPADRLMLLRRRQQRRLLR